MLVAGAVLAALAPGCGAAPAPPPLDTGACQPDHLDACERRLAAQVKDDAAEEKLVAEYAAARAARDAADPWARLFHALREAKADGAVVLAEGGAAAPASGGLRVVTSAELPAPSAMAAEELLLAMARAAGVSHVVRVRPAGRGANEVTQLFPADPLAPFLAGLRPVVRDDGALAHLEGDVAMARAVRAAFDAAGAFRYVDAAREAEKLASLVPAEGPLTEPVLRARYALQLLGAAGLVLDPAAPHGAKAAAPAGAVPAPDANETPYGALLVVLTARDGRAAWETRGARVLEGIAADRREDVTALFARPKGCEPLRAPPMEGRRDLVHANRLAGALARDAGGAARAGGLPFAEWLGRYEATVRLVEQTRTAWSYLPALLAERGEASGLDPAESAAYRKVTEMGLAHVAAMRALEGAEPVRYRAFTQLGLGLAPGLHADARLQRAMVELTEASIKDKLATAADPEALLGTVATGVVAGLSYPPALQEAHFGALQGAVTAKLKGDLTTRTGWGVAALYAADALYRIVADARPDLDGSASQIVRALGGPGVEQPALAALAGAAARYAALAAAHKLDPTVTRAEKIPPERRAAREGLHAALAGLGAPGEAPSNVLDDLTELADGLAATLSMAIAEGAAAKKSAAEASGDGGRAKGGKRGAKRGRDATEGRPAAAVCGPKPTVAIDAATRRALARLGDVRRRILGHPRYKEGDGAWIRRARLVTTILSDAMDLAIASDTRKPPVFTVTAAEAEKAWRDSIGREGERGLSVATAASGGYALLRTFAGSASAEAFVKQGGRDLRQLAQGLLALFQDDASGGPAMGTALLRALAGAKGIGAGTGEDVGAALVAYADWLYGRGQQEQADLCMLAAMVAGSIAHKPPPKDAAALAAKHGSRIAWALRMMSEIRKDPKDGLPDPAVYAEGLRRATDDACQAADADATLAVVTALRDFAAGKRKEARAALDGVLERADAHGLGVPRMVYRYDEKTASKVFSVDIGISYGSGILLAGNSFELGLAARSGGEPEGSLSASLVPPDTSKAGEDAARYYVYTAAIATVYHLLDGDLDRAVASGRRAVGALSSGVRLGARRLRSERPAAWGEDAREILVIAAQLAADAGMPFLAGDLWTVVRQGFADTLDDKAVAGMLDHPPLGLGGIAEMPKVIARAQRSLAVLAEPLPCTDAKVELGAFDEVSCDAYPLALSLRAADALKKLPRLHRSPETTARCGSLKSLDAFLAGVARGTYDPDAFTRAVEALRAAGKTDDAAVLLSRQRRPDHCSATLVSAARALGRSPLFGPSLRADLLSLAVNCTAVAGGAEVDADVMALDEETSRLPDPARNLKLLLSVADLAVTRDRWASLGKLTDRPDFLSRWLRVHPNAAAVALVLDHAAAVMRGQPVALDRTKPTFHLLCETFPSTERAEMCTQAAALRKAEGSAAERERTAKEAVRRMVASAVGKGK
ncbi:Exonuclease SbcC [Minicystis rosea]|nr:Exonuclease SbcC [Minicystis rosea]